MRAKTWTLAAVMAGLSAPALADDTNALGGRVGARQGYVIAGWPAIEGGVRLPFGDFEVAPRMAFRFPVSFTQASPNQSTDVKLLGMFFGSGFRYQVLDKGKWSGAVTFAVDIAVIFEPRPVTGGIAIGDPGFLVTYAVAPGVDLDFGLKFQPFITFRSPVTFYGRFPFLLGMEFEATDRITVLVQSEVGALFQVTRAGNVDIITSTPWGSLLAGITVDF